MRVRVTNMIGIQSADLKLAGGRIAAVSGSNASGKSSLATVMAGALAMDANPLHAGKGGGKVYSRDDTDDGMCEVFGDDGQPVIRWMAGSGDLAHYGSASKPPSPASLGLVHFCEGTMSSVARTALWEECFLPPIHRLHGLMGKQLEAYVDDKTLGHLMNMIADYETSDDPDIEQANAKRQIDDVAAVYKKRATDAKAAWMKVTGEAYGVRKAADWIPEGWHSELDGLTAAAAKQVVDTASGVLRNLHVQVAISVSDMERAREAEARLPELEADRDTARTAFREADLALQDASKGLFAADTDFKKKSREHAEIAGRQPKRQDTLTCPSCQAALLLTTGKLVAHDELAFKDQEQAWSMKCQNAKRLAEDAQARLQEAKVDVAPFRATATDKKAVLDAAEAEVRACVAEARNANEKVEDADHASAVVEAEESRNKAQRHLALVKARAEAKEHHENVITYTAIAEVVGPKGIRATVMEKAMKNVDGVLEKICTMTGWPRIKVDRTYAVSIAGRTLLRVTARSERLRAQYSLQIAVARCLRDPVVILDEADWLDQSTQQLAQLGNLLRTLCSRPNPPAFVVFGTDMDLAAFNQLGDNYMVTDGVLRQV